MKLSVIIISYNEAEYISKAVLSCLQQNKADFEIIIGDDGSKDGSIDIIKGFGDKVKYFVMDRNEKYIIPSIRVSNIIKRALSIAEGEYVCILSGDDYYCDFSRFSEHCEFLDNHKEYVAVFSSYQKEYIQEEKNCVYEGFTNNRKLFWSKSYAHISCFTFRKNIYNNDMLLDRMCDDTGLIYSIAASGKWKYLNKNTFSYVQHESSIMHKADPLELSLLEMMLFQDVLNKKKMIITSYSRFYRPFSYVLKNRQLLSEDKYDKYIVCCCKYDNDLVGLINKFSSLNLMKRLRIRLQLFFSFVCHLIFGSISKIMGLI